MKGQKKTPLPRYQPTEAEIREKARELYVASGFLGGRDLDNWLEAEAFLLAHPPTPASRHPFMGKVRSHSPHSVERRCA